MSCLQDVFFQVALSRSRSLQGTLHHLKECVTVPKSAGYHLSVHHGSTCMDHLRSRRTFDIECLYHNRTSQCCALLKVGLAPRESKAH